MIISDLNYLENVSEQDKLIGGKKKTTIVAFSNVTQSNNNLTLQIAVSVFGSASNTNSTGQFNSVSL